MDFSDIKKQRFAKTQQLGQLLLSRPPNLGPKVWDLSGDGEWEETRRRTGGEKEEQQKKEEVKTPEGGSRTGRRPNGEPGCLRQRGCLTV